MISRNLYLNIVIRVVLITGISVLAGFFLAHGKAYLIATICMSLVVLLVFNLIHYLNSVNRTIRFFFEAIRNDDSNLSFPTDSRNKGMHQLYESMTRVNEQIRQLKIENRQQEQYFRTLIEHLATGIITYNSKGFILHANTAVKKLLSATILTHLQQIARIDQKLYQAISNIRPFENRLVSFSAEKGDTQLSLKATSLRTDEEELTILSFQDIKSELDEKEIDSWLKLIRVLMHEIMNSITPITSLSESLSKVLSKDGNPVLPEEVNEKTISKTLQGLKVIREQGKGLMSFVESYRKLTRVPDPDRKLFRVSDFLKRIQILFKSLEQKNRIELSVMLKDPDLEIFADENLISQVLINLLKNALEANEVNPLAEIKIRAGIGSDNHSEICVIDNGPGIPVENLDEIFVPFFTTRPNGSGIGLSISKQIMRVHGGTLKVRSVPGKETLFCLSF
jgi:nitrogen fixation/metabolism regulation signal transduction histidine kinase